MAQIHIRPCAIEEHPALTQKYIIPTPAIDTFYQRVKKCIKVRTLGAIIFAHPRFGKTYATRYVMNVLPDDFPNILVIRFLCLKTKTHSESAFFSNLLEAIQHEKAQTGHASRKRVRLTHRLMMTRV